MEKQPDARWLKGIDEFNRGLFFDCHETLEEIWLEEHGNDREFYQGIIQIAAAYFKWEQNVPMGTFKLMRSGLNKLLPYGPVHNGIDMRLFAESVQIHLAKVESFNQDGGDMPDLAAPHLTLKTGNATR